MATYVIGDVHGRLETLGRLLSSVSFDRTVDQLWFVGDLVNRGPQSIETIEFVRGLGSSAVTVLGNHDLSLLAVSERVMYERPDDRFGECLAHPAADRALRWLRAQNLIRFDARRSTILVHAGLPHVWRLRRTRARAAQLEMMLNGPRSENLRALGFLRRRGIVSPRAHSSLGVPWRVDDDLVYCLNALVHLRRIAADGSFPVDEATADALDPQYAAGCVPWFERWPARWVRNASAVFFGHWARLGGVNRPPFFGLDANCARGGSLAAMNVDSRTVYTVVCDG